MEERAMTRKQYNQPEVQVNAITLTTTILLGSPTPYVNVNIGVETNDVW